MILNLQLEIGGGGVDLIKEEQQKKDVKIYIEKIMLQNDGVQLLHLVHTWVI